MHAAPFGAAYGTRSGADGDPGGGAWLWVYFECVSFVRSPVRRAAPPRRLAELRIDSFALKACPELPVHLFCFGGAAEGED